MNIRDEHRRDSFQTIDQNVFPKQRMYFDTLNVNSKLRRGKLLQSVLDLFLVESESYQRVGLDT